MKNKFFLTLTSIILLFSTNSLIAQTDYLGSVGLPAHPRLLLLRGQEEMIKNTIANDNSLNKVHNAIIAESDKLVLLPSVERKMIGNQMLETSREAFRRIFYLAYAYRLTHNVKYFRQAEQELLKVCSYSDWNPKNSFLDDAEMTTAVSIGYDWLYDSLSSSDRSIIKSAIIEKGLKPSLDTQNNVWLKWTNNWNQVCNTGMALGALAVYEDNPTLAKTIINRAIQTVPLSMVDEYAPNGCFIEGYSYWDYGTAYNVLLISALQNAFHSDFGLTKQPGFMSTAAYFENMVGATGASFNYSDSFGGDLSTFPDAPMFWFANQLKDPSLLWLEKGYLIKSQSNTFVHNRFLPALLIWSTGLNLTRVTAPSNRMWVGKGKNAVAVLRTSWTDPNAIYVGVKAGSPSVSHGHMDVGSFIMEANGVRWAIDIGGADYNAVLSKGIKLWDYAQSSQRWTAVPQYNNMSHNTLTVNNGLQNVKGRANFTSYSSSPSFTNVVTDITSVYQDNLKSAIRGVAIMKLSLIFRALQLNGLC
jgi:hypothetical protein